MKKNLLFLFVAILAIGFTSCDKDDKDKPTPGSTDLKSVTITPSELSMTKGTTERLTAVTDPTDWNGDFTWTSSNEDAFTVDSHGNVTALDVTSGEAVITVTAGEKTATAAVHIQDEYDSYNVQFSIYGLYGESSKAWGDTAMVFEMAALSQDGFLNAKYQPEGTGFYSGIPWVAGITKENGKLTGLNPYKYAQDLTYEGVDFDAWTLAIAAGGDPTVIYGKVRLGKYHPDRYTEWLAALINKQTPTDVQKNYHEGTKFYNHSADGFLNAGALTAAEIRFDTLEYQTQFMEDGKPMMSPITKFDLTYTGGNGFETITLKAGDVFPTPYFGDSAGKQVPEDGEYYKYPYTVKTRVYNYSGDYLDVAVPRKTAARAPRFIAAPKVLFGYPVEVVNGEDFISIDLIKFNSASNMGIMMIK